MYIYATKGFCYLTKKNSLNDNLYVTIKKVKKKYEFVLQSYLVECNKDIQAPEYLRRNRHKLAAPSFDFSSILVDNTNETGHSFRGNLRSNVKFLKILLSKIKL